MNNQYIQYALKWAVIEWNLPRVFQHCKLWWETRSELYNVLVFQKLYKLCVTHGHNFSKTKYPAVRNSSRWSTKMSIWICWDVGVKNSMRFSNFRPPQLPRRSSANSRDLKHLRRGRKRERNYDVACSRTLGREHRFRRENWKLSTRVLYKDEDVNKWGSTSGGFSYVVV